MAHDKFTQRMASTSHILLGNHKVIHTNRSAPITSFCPIQVNRVGSLDLAVETCLKHHLRNQRSTACQGTHRR